MFFNLALTFYLQAELRFVLMNGLQKKELTHVPTPHCFR